MQTETEGLPRPTESVECEGCNAIRESGGSTCGDCGTFLSIVPPDEMACLYCADPIGHFDILVSWPAAGVRAHFACYATAQHLVRAVGGAS